MLIAILPENQSQYRYTTEQQQHNFFFATNTPFKDVRESMLWKARTGKVSTKPTHCLSMSGDQYVRGQTMKEIS
jgi:hypothetical protein